MISTGSGQKLCRLVNSTSPASNIFWIPGMSEMRMPWPSSMRLNPSSLISRSISSPAVWRPEFQQVENAITIKQWLRLAAPAFHKLAVIEDGVLRTPIAQQRDKLREMGAPISAETYGSTSPRRGVMPI